MFSLNFMFFCSLIEELCTKEENYKTSCNFNFGHECNLSNMTKRDREKRPRVNPAHDHRIKKKLEEYSKQ